MKIIIVLRIFLVLLCTYVGITALWGGISLVFSGGSEMGLTLALLESTPFSDYTIPGLILACVVGGSNIFAAIFLVRKNVYRYEAAAIAGFSLLLWLFVELFLLPDHHFIQAVYVTFAVSMLVLIMILLKYDKQFKK